jgi:two-component system heavy metal sensor histidine kinase CusS
MSSMRPPEAGPRARGFSLAARLAIAYAAAAFALVLGAAIALDAVLADVLERDLETALSDEARELAIALRDPDPVQAIRDFVRRAEGHEHPRILLRVRRADGELLAESAGMAKELPIDGPPVLARARGERVSTSGRRWATLRRPVEREDGEHFLIEAAGERKELEKFLAKYRSRAATVLGIALFSCVAGAYAIARRGLAPIARVTSAARLVSSQTIGAARIDLRGAPAEIAELAETINAMLDRLGEAFRKLKDLGADLAHELRTPVQNLRGEAEVALLKDRSPDEYRAALGAVLEECDRLSRLIDDVLLIERTEARPELDLAEIDLARELDELRSYYEASASARGIAIAAAPAPERLPIRADRTKIRRALGNLIDNAIKYTPEGGRVALAARDAGPDGVEIAIEDQGIGIAPADLERVFDRFFRAEKSRARAGPGGVGLGLPIARALVRAHGGEVTLESEVGRGTKAIVRLPRRAGEAALARAENEE